MLEEIRHRPQASVAVNRQDYDTAMFVVGHQDPASRRIAAQVTWLTTKAGPMTQRRELACGTVHFERRHRTTSETQALAHGKQKSVGRIEGQKRGVDFADCVQKLELPAQLIVLEDVNALGPA
jgi:hypothetical protein